MAEILIRATNVTTGHPLAWLRAQPVIMFENGHTWGTLEALPPAQGGNFVVVQIADVTVAQVQNFLQNRWGIDLDAVQYDANANAVARRIIAVLVDLLPLAVRQQLNQTGFFSTTWLQIRTFIKNNVTGETFA